MYRPDFPVHSYVDLRKSKIPLGDPRSFPWETTYRHDMRPKSREANEQALDTITLQRTHWIPGDLRGTTISEMHDKYRRYQLQTQDAARTRDEMMRTSFELGDGSPMASRHVEPYVPVNVEQNSLREQMVSTHFNLKNPTEQASGWESTNRHDFRRFEYKPVEIADMGLNRGLGAKATFENLGCFGPTRSLNSDTYVAYRDLQRPKNRDVSIRGGLIEFGQNDSNKWRRTNWQMGDTEKRYSTTTGDALMETAKVRVEVDPDFMEECRRRGQRSHVVDGNNWPAVTETTAHAAMRAHPGFQPPPLSERTAFQSHQNFGDWKEQMSTTSRDSYPPRKYQPVESIDHHLQESHAKFGADNINEKTTLYNESFKRPPPTMERTDMQAARDFHMGHHSNNRTAEFDHTGKSINSTTYTGCKGGKASDLCDALKGGHNIVPNDARFNVKESTMKADYVKYKNAKLPDPIDNSLYASHITM